MQFRFFNPVLPLNVTSGNLPHWEQKDATYFITWRTADSIPAETWKHWRRLRAEWLTNHGIDTSLGDWRKQLEELSSEKRREFRRFAKDLENEIDRCHGSCPLRKGCCSEIVAEALQHFDGKRYLLGDFVVMPNHVHLLVAGLGRDRLLPQVESWKKWSAVKINQYLGQKGRFWQDESFDHLVRDQAAFDRYRRYIAENPEKAKLRAKEFLYWRRPDFVE